jgi:dipeptidyl aminopeptidase/acylaminoacyl peptidase
MTSSWFNVSSTGSSLLFQAGPFEAAVLAFEATPSGSGKIRQVLSSTTPLGGRISPDGRRIAVIRRVLADGVSRDQIWLMPYVGGELTQLTPALDDINDFEWNPDGRGIVYIHRLDNEMRSVAEVDTTGKVREILKGETGPISGVQVLADNRILITNADGSEFFVMDRTGRTQARWKIPAWAGSFTSSSSSPDGKSIAMIGWDHPFDSILVAKVDVATGRFDKVAAMSGEGFDRIKWTSDNRFLFDIGESSGRQMLYSVTPEGTSKREVGVLPRFRALYTIADDGKHVAGFTENDKSDVYMIRNLADILKR